MGGFENRYWNLLQVLAWVYLRDRKWVDAASDREPPIDDLDSETLASDVLFAEVTVIDSDGASDTASVDIGGLIVFADDGPSVWPSLTGAGGARDERVRAQNDGTAAMNVTALFEDVAGTGSDSGTRELPGYTLPGYAQSPGAAVSLPGGVSGADEKNGTTSFALSLSVSGGINAGLATTDGTSIFLFLEDGIVVGRVGDHAGNAAFAIAINSSTGVISVVQYLSVKHSVGADLDTTDADLVRIKTVDDLVMTPPSHRITPVEGLTFEVCEREIITACEAGRLVPTGVANDQGDPIKIPREQWAANLEFCYDPLGAAPPAHDRREGATRWSNLMFPSETVLELWPDLEAELTAGEDDRAQPDLESDLAPEQGGVASKENRKRPADKAALEKEYRDHFDAVMTEKGRYSTFAEDEAWCRRKGVTRDRMRELRALFRSDKAKKGGAPKKAHPNNLAE